MRFVLLTIAALALHAQPPTFEVASIKAAPPLDPHATTVGCKGGPGSKEAGRWMCENMSLQDLILMAYDIQPLQLTGPGWLNQARFNIVARIPAGATKPEFRQMLQTLLGERFRLKLHRERKEGPGYDLVVAKNGPKLTVSKPRDPDAPPPKISGGLKTGPDGLPELPPGVPMMVSSAGKVRRQAVGDTMQDLAALLARRVGRPVTDATGLKDKYDFTLTWSSRADVGARLPIGHGGPGASAPPPDDYPTLMNAIQEQLGLKLEPKKGQIEVLVIDSVEKVPTAN